MYTSSSTFGHVNTTLKAQLFAEFILLGLGISLWGRELSLHSLEFNHLRNLLSIGVTLLVLVLALWQVLDGREEKRLRQTVNDELIRV